MTTLPHLEASPSCADDVFIGTSSSVKRLRLQVARIAPHFRVAVLTGEPGSGKHSVALQLHRSSPATGRPFTVIQATEFVQQAKPPAVAGTIYLPGLDTLHPASQSKLLLTLRSLPRNTRVVVASQSDLKGLVSSGRMRHDLYEKVGTLEIRIPPLRDRIEDLDPILHSMLQRLATSTVPDVATLARMRCYSWPGNLAELQAICEELARTGSVLAMPQLDQPAPGPPAPARLDEVMHRHVLDVLESCAGNKLRAAEALGISRSTLYRMLGTQTSLPG